VKSFDGKVAAITGAGSGIGRALALALARRGCHLALSDINLEAVEETARLVSPGVRVSTAKLDVADRAAVERWADGVVREQGKVNLVFNNAGVALGSTLEGVSYEDFEWIMGVNFWGVVYGTKAFLPHLRASGEGHVVNVSSVFGLIAAPGNGAYNATKFAVRGFTEALRQELEMMRAPVSATSVHPGGIKTNIARSSRVSDNLVGFLVKDKETAGATFDKMFITPPEKAAETILRGVRRNARRVLVGPDAHAIDVIARVLPSASQKIIMAWTRRVAQ
jgi:NAD(P)-dependent dehydrogenase (short-subunit alcohol dehydrogenase family)